MPDNSIESLVRCTSAYYSLWRDISQGSTPDPYITDGRMMNFVREKIIQNKIVIRQYYEDMRLPLPMVCSLPDPVIMSEDYMVNSNLLIRAARLVINALKKSESYRDFVSVAGALPVRERANRPIADKLKLLSALEQAAKANDAFEIRKHVSMNIKSEKDAENFVENIVQNGVAAVKKVKQCRS